MEIFSTNTKNVKKGTLGAQKEKKHPAKVF